MSSDNTQINGEHAYRFSDLVDVPAFARLLEHFYQVSGIPNGVVDENGELLCMSSGANACEMFHRATPQTAERCRQSNLELVRDLREGGVAGGVCKNGLMDYATPVVIEGRQLVTLFLGPVLHAAPDMERFRAQAAQLGFDEASYLKSIEAIAVVDKKRLNDLMGVMVELAQMLAASGLTRLRQATLERDISTHAERSIQLKDILDFSPVAMGWSEDEHRIEYVNRQFTLLFGYTLDDLPSLDVWYQRAYPDENYRDTVVGPWRKAVAQAKKSNTPPPALEAVITCKDGSVRSIIVRVAWVGHHRMVSFTDITEHKRLVDTLRASEAKSSNHDRLLQAVLESSPEVIVFALDHKYRYLAFNDKHRATMLAIWGKEIAVGMNMLDVIGTHPDREKARQGFDRALTGEAFITEDAYGDEAILRMYWQNFFAPIQGEDGSTIGLTCFVLNITDRRRMEQALAEREQEFRSLAESSPDVVIRVDRDHRIRYLNANMVKFLELGSAQEVIGRRSKEKWPDGRFDEIDALREHVVTTGEMKSIELIVPVQGGNKAHHHVISVPERDIDGHIIGTITFGRDITAIRETERRLNSLVENLPGVVYTIRLSPYGGLSFPYVSAGVEEIYGISPDVAMSDFEVMHGMIHPDDKANMEKVYAESVRTLTPFRAEVRICPPRQTVRWLDMRSDPEAQPDGSILSYGLIFDITERKRMEQALAERERELRTLVENLPDNITRYTTDARHTYVSPSIERVLGKPTENLLGRTPSECAADENTHEVERRIRAVAATGVSDEMEYTLPIANNETRYHLLRFVAERDESNHVTGVLGIGTDITERRRTERRLQAHDEMLEMVARGNELTEILEAIVRYMESEDQTAHCSILLTDLEGTHLLSSVAPSLPAFYNEAINGIDIREGVGSCGTAAALGKRVVVEDIQTHEYWISYRQLAKEAGLQACWSEPILSSKGKVLGTFAIYHALPQGPQSQDIDRIIFAAHLSAIAIENHQVRDELERQAHFDYLTGLDNRRHFLGQAEIELARTLRYDRALSILMIDIDHFKQVNDTYGHKVGDIVLQNFASVCRATLRNIDIIGRIGGEEFAVLLPEAGREQAMEAAERLRAALASAQVKLDNGLPLHFTASFGVVTLEENDTNIDILLNQADQALYRAKSQGRNRVCMYQGGDAGTAKANTSGTP
ncbi:MAG: diguanylate cyclase [Gallionella sp.]|nr:diguanylate cyclase [Gallionella sp.]